MWSDKQSLFQHRLEVYNLSAEPAHLLDKLRLHHRWPRLARLAAARNWCQWRARLSPGLGRSRASAECSGRENHLVTQAIQGIHIEAESVVTPQFIFFSGRSCASPCEHHTTMQLKNVSNCRLNRPIMIVPSRLTPYFCSYSFLMKPLLSSSAIKLGSINSSGLRPRISGRVCAT